jgi:hypothetical protein
MKEGPSRPSSQVLASNRCKLLSSKAMVVKTFVPYSPFGRSLFGHGFSLRCLVLPVARDIEADLLWDSPSRASFGKAGSIIGYSEAFDGLTDWP